MSIFESKEWAFLKILGFVLFECRNNSGRKRWEKGRGTDKKRNRAWLLWLISAVICSLSHLLTSLSPPPSLTDSPSIKAQSGPGWAAVKRQTIYQPVSSCCLLFQPARLHGSPRPNNSDWGELARYLTTPIRTYTLVYAQRLLKSKRPVTLEFFIKKKVINFLTFVSERERERER